MNTTFLHNRSFQIGVASVLSASAGGYGGYRIAQKRLRAHYEEIADREIREARDHYARVYEKTLSPEELLEKLHNEKLEAGEGVPDEIKDVLTEYGSARMGIDNVERPAETEEELVIERELDVEKDSEGNLQVVGSRRIYPGQNEKQNIFAGTQPVEGDALNDPELLMNRDETRPYVITHDEYYEGEKDYEQTDLTFYEGDGVLADLRDVPIPDEDNIVGSDNLLKFGAWSNDENIVYVRNDKIEVDFEITRSVGSYTQEVAGFDPDEGASLKHSATRGKFRHQD
jgi:hypothetical protein